MKTVLLVVTSVLAFVCARAEAEGTEQLGKLAQDVKYTSAKEVVIKPGERITTKSVFLPPVEITIVAKTEKNNLRLAYAADQVIFNWERNPSELRVDGGPASGRHVPGAGTIPKNKFVTVRWIVTRDRQQIYVDGDIRFDHRGDYSQLDRPVSIFAGDSMLTVSSIKVQQLSK